LVCRFVKAFRQEIWTNDTICQQTCPHTEVPTNLTLSVARKMWILVCLGMYVVCVNYSHLGKMQLISPQHTCDEIGIFVYLFDQPSAVL
jgi:hypothetical protein